MSTAKALEYLELAKRELLAPVSPYAWARTDRTPAPKPIVPSLGPPGVPFTDPTFGARLVRVTDHLTANGASWRVPSNAHLAAWSADSRHFYVTGNAGKRVYALDGFQAFARGAIPSQTEPHFSRVDPDVLFTVGGPITRTIQRSSLKTKTVTDLLDLDTLGLPLATPRTYVGGIGSSAAPEVLVAFFGGEQADLHHYVLWLPLDGRPRKVIDTLPLGYHLHAVSVDLSGRYVILYPPGPDLAKGLAPKIVWDTQTDTFTPLPLVAAKIGGHDALGYGVMVNMDGGDAVPWDAAQWQLRTLADPLHPRTLIDPLLTPKEVYLDDHTSWNHAAVDGHTPVISSTFRTTADPSPLRAWDEELLAIALDGTVSRFCHHRSALGSFWDQPLVNVSPDGRFAIVTSNWERTLGVDPDGQPRQDVFLVELGR